MTDFFTQIVWTMRGPVVYYVLFLIHIQTRHVHIAGITLNPDNSCWMVQQTMDLSKFFAEQEEFKPMYSHE